MLLEKVWYQSNTSDCLARVLIDEAIEKNKVSMEEMEKSRDALLGEMSNWLHPRYLPAFKSKT